MVEIEATIIDIDIDRAKELGINWRLTDGDDVSIGFGNGSASDLRLRDGVDVDDITPLSRGLSVSSIIGWARRSSGRARSSSRAVSTRRWRRCASTACS